MELAGESLGRRIARLRNQKGWNQRELASRAGIKASSISKLEHDRSRPRIEDLPRLAAALDVTVDYLLTGRWSREDARFRERLASIDELPEPQRDNLVSFLDALIGAHEGVRRQQERVGARHRLGLAIIAALLAVAFLIPAPLAAQVSPPSTNLACREVELAHPPRWTLSGAWVQNGSVLLLIDVYGNRLLRYSDQGDFLGSVPFLEAAIGRPPRLRLGDGGCRDLVDAGGSVCLG